MPLKTWLLVVLVAWTSACVSLHHVQVGEVDGGTQRRAFEIKVSEVGVSLDEAKRTINHASRKKEPGKALEYLEYTQMGPRTGNPVFDEDYANDVWDLIYRECPSGKVSGLLSIREQARYPVITGEIVKVTGWCLK